MITAMRAVAVPVAAVVVLLSASSSAAKDRSIGSFYSPSRNIECRFSNGAVVCAAFSTRRIAILNPSIPTQVLSADRGFGNNDARCKVFPYSEDVPCWFQPGGRGPVLAVGTTATDPLGQVLPGSGAKHT